MRGGIGDAIRKWQPSNPESFAEGVVNKVKFAGKAALPLLTGGTVPKSLPFVIRTALGATTGPIADILLNPTEANAMDDVEAIRKYRQK